MESVLDKILEVFIIDFMFCVIMASYFIIKVIDYFNGDKAVPTWAKRIITFIVGSVCFYGYWKFANYEFQNLLASYFAAVFCYDTAIKFFIEKLNISYRKDADNN